MKHNNVLIFKAASEEHSLASQDFKDPYQEQLESMNCNVVVVNTLDFIYTNMDILRQRLESPERYSAIVFGSPRCANAVAKAVEKLDDRWKRLPAFAVGETTGRIVSDKLGLTTEGTNTGHGAALAPLILQSTLPQPVLMPVGNLSRDTISKVLQDRGVCVETVQVYETVPHPDLENKLKKTLKNFSFNVIVYFSPSGINATLPLLQKYSVPLEEIKMVAIGPTTEKAMEELDLKVSATAPKPTPSSLASAIYQILH